MKRFLVALLYLIVSSVNAQNSISKVLDAYDSYFELRRETVHLHTNKTSYLPGEKIWFTAFVYDKKLSAPSNQTNHLVCVLFNDKGQSLNEASIEIRNGTGSGYFEIPKKLKGTRLFLKAHTEWMKNFIEDNSFVSELRLEPLNAAIETVSGVSDDLFDISILPEGGHLVANTLNTVGFKITNGTRDNVFPKSISLESIGGATLISSITVNKYGEGRFEFTPNSAQDYTLLLQLDNDRKISFPIERAKKTGMVLSVNNLFDDKITIVIKTNELTLEQLAGKDHFVAIHRDGLLKLNAFQMSDTEHVLNISRKDLLPGTNIITVFDSQINPILERLVFNEADLKKATAEVFQYKNATLKDSVSLRINLFSMSNSPAKLSISVLPSTTQSRNTKQSIFSSFWLQPYVKGNIENGGRFFSNIDRIKKYELDVMLMVQGWSRYEWANIFSNPPTQRFKPEDGFEISGKVLNAIPEKDLGVVLYQKSSPEIWSSEINANKDFKIKNAKVYKDEKVYFSLLNNRNKTKSAQLVAKVNPRKSEEQHILNKSYLRPNFIGYQEERRSKPDIGSSFLEDDKAIVLNEVTVTDKRIEKKLNRNTSLPQTIFSGFKVTEEEIKNKKTLRQLIQNLGFRTLRTYGGEVILPRSNIPGIGLPVVIVDDILMFHPARDIANLPPNLLDSNANGIDEIYYTHQTIETGYSPVIYIYRKYGSIVGEKPEERFAYFMATEGFQRPQEFYLPKYASFTSESFKSFGTIYWESQLLTNDQKEAFLVIPNLEQEEVAVFIEGMAEDGTLISEVKKVSLVH